MNRRRVGEDRESKEMDRCPLTGAGNNAGDYAGWGGWGEQRRGVGGGGTGGSGGCGRVIDGREGEAESGARKGQGIRGGGQTGKSSV
jgi:hypothetical protein